MSSCQKATKPLSRCLQLRPSSLQPIPTLRPFSTSSLRQNDLEQQAAPPSPPPSPTNKPPTFDPLTVSTSRGERILISQGIHPIGSRRRRAAIKSSTNIPFEKLPYQCFQEALKVLRADREEKIAAIEVERGRIARLVAQDPSTVTGGERMKETRLDSMRRHLEQLKILADINDPLVKKRFEDGQGDMSKPIYRYLADKKWRSYQRLIIAQRISQLNIVPDVYPYVDPTADVRLAFGRRSVQPGEFIDSRVSEIPVKLQVQVFDKGERLITVAVVDSDVPDLENDSFTSRCHFLATNIPISPTETSLPLSKVPEAKVALPWLPPFAQKGSPYHRYSVFVLQHQPGQVLDVSALKETYKRDGFYFRSFVDKHLLKPIGVGIFRSIWDEGTAGVMQRAGIEGADIEFKRKKVEALKPKQKARGWEAIHAKAKYNLKTFRR